MWAGASFGVPLKTECGAVGAGDTLQAAVEKRTMSCLEIRRQRIFIHRKPVILAGNKDSTGFDVLHGMVRAMMTELHLDGFGATGQRQQLVPQTDTENRHIVLQHFS